VVQIRKKRLTAKRKFNKVCVKNTRRALIVVLSLYGTAQLVPTTHAWLIDKSINHSNQFQAAFVFPATIGDMVDEAEANSYISYSFQTTDNSIEEVNNQISMVEETLTNAHHKLQSNQNLMDQISGYLERAKSDVNKIEVEMDNKNSLVEQNFLSNEDKQKLLMEIENLNKKLSSANRVLNYIKEGHQQIQTALNNTVTNIDELESTLSALRNRQTELELEEQERLKQEQLKKEQEQLEQQEKEQNEGEDNNPTPDVPSVTPPAEEEQSNEEQPPNEEQSADVMDIGAEDQTQSNTESEVPVNEESK
jgi:DNA repair exonuclease SbcCD ATPase subunit